MSDEPQCTRRARDVLRRIYFEAEPLLQRHTELQQSEFWPLHSSSQIETSTIVEEAPTPTPLRSSAAGTISYRCAKRSGKLKNQVVMEQVNKLEGV